MLALKIIFFSQEKLKAQGKMDKTKANEIFRYELSLALFNSQCFCISMKYKTSLEMVLFFLVNI